MAILLSRYRYSTRPLFFNEKSGTTTVRKRNSAINNPLSPVRPERRRNRILTLAVFHCYPSWKEDDSFEKRTHTSRTVIIHGGCLINISIPPPDVISILWWQSSCANSPLRTVALTIESMVIANMAVPGERKCNDCLTGVSPSILMSVGLFEDL
ncbi:hypothetical protein HAPAU_37060 [Halalkalicoccus paucihalophilus]|uniref:Uncharacterized protein n=1 Tax=Halalkalicoccus paucihalophilus TaxID=1008153 RepID=A0A151A9C2_9EURY|nr:hypothetical protein HAPAU_37060 [Halalkalicoccus paucihalophilus]